MNLKGKGFFIWKIRGCEGGNPDAISQTARSAGLSHVLIKIADGTYPSNLDTVNGVDLIPPIVSALHNQAIQVLGWHYVYGDDPVGEARIATQRTNNLGLDGYVIDAESEYKQTGKDAAARRFMTELRSGLPRLPVALCSYRFPTYHLAFPWQDFLLKCDFNMPQVYWEKAHNAGAQLERSVREFQSISPFRPIFPVGSAYHSGDWAASAEEVLEYLQTAQNLNLSGVSFFSWDDCHPNLPQVWSTIASFPWASGTTEPSDMGNRYINSLNTHDPEKVISLYDPNAIHITALRTVQGTDELRSWYATLFNQILPGGVFSLTGSKNSKQTFHITWNAFSKSGKVINGSDTIGLSGDKISYHFANFSVLPL